MWDRSIEIAERHVNCRLATRARRASSQRCGAPTGLPRRAAGGRGAVLRRFMRDLGRQPDIGEIETGLDARPTPSGRRTPTIIVSVPLSGLDEPVLTAGGRMVQQAFAQGVHGVHLARARDPEGVGAFCPGRPLSDPQAGHLSDSARLSSMSTSGIGNIVVQRGGLG